LCELGGSKVCFGFNGLTNGSMKSSNIKRSSLEKAKFFGFKGMGN
jgi:urease subunit beta